MADPEQGRGGAGGARTRVLALLALLAVGTPLVLLALRGNGEAGARGLTIEIAPPAGAGPTDLIVYVEAAANRPATASGRSSVRLECLDASGRVALSRRAPWPLTETDGGTLDPHIHQTLGLELIGQLETCRLAGTDGPLAGTVQAKLR